MPIRIDRNQPFVFLNGADMPEAKTQKGNTIPAHVIALLSTMVENGSRDRFNRVVKPEIFEAELPAGTKIPSTVAPNTIVNVVDGDIHLQPSGYSNTARVTARGVAPAATPKAQS